MSKYTQLVDKIKELQKTAKDAQATNPLGEAFYALGGQIGICSKLLKFADELNGSCSVEDRLKSLGERDRDKVNEIVLPSKSLIDSPTYNQQIELFQKENYVRTICLKCGKADVPLDKVVHEGCGGIVPMVYDKNDEEGKRKVDNKIVQMQGMTEKERGDDYNLEQKERQQKHQIESRNLKATHADASS